MRRQAIGYGIAEWLDRFAMASRWRAASSTSHACSNAAFRAFKERIDWV
ncbi:MAG: hypothetical protein IH787_07770 [Nitrospirae bacterium]|nr:hypothetical protein [Nitrospirota bacterium]